MRKPAHATPQATHLAVKVFVPGKRDVQFERIGQDPAKLARDVASHPDISIPERSKVRKSVKDALTALAEKTVPDMTSAQLDVGGRRLRLTQVYAT